MYICWYPSRFRGPDGLAFSDAAMTFRAFGINWFNGDVQVPWHGADDEDINRKQIAVAKATSVCTMHQALYLECCSGQFTRGHSLNRQHKQRNASWPVILPMNIPLRSVLVLMS